MAAIDARRIIKGELSGLGMPWRTRGTITTPGHGSDHPLGLEPVENSRYVKRRRRMIELRFIALSVLPPNKWLQLTSQLVTPFAYAKVAPSCLAAEPGC